MHRTEEKMRKSKYTKNSTEELINLLIEKDNQIKHLKHIIDVADVWDIVMHLTGDPDEYITYEKPMINNNPLGIPVPEPF